MGRAPFQVLVFPFRAAPDGGFEYALFFRRTERYGNFWQAISGGGEDDETPVQAARREMYEETRIDTGAEFIQLESMCMLPADVASGELLWGEEVLVVPEYTFALRADGQEIRLSPEHEAYRWVDYEAGQDLLRWDSNRNALWELNYKLTHGLI